MNESWPIGLLFLLAGHVYILLSAPRVRLDVNTNRTLGDKDTSELLDKLFREKYEASMATFMEDFMKRGIEISFPYLPWILGCLGIAPDKVLFHPKSTDIFLFVHKNIYCGYVLEACQGGASNEYHQHMVSYRNKKNNMWIPLLIWGYALAHFCQETPKRVIGNCADPIQMLQNEASNQGLHCLQIQPFVCRNIKIT